MIVFCFGTRPEAIKLGPVVAALRTPHRLLCTNQHTTLLLGTPVETDLSSALSLGIPPIADLDTWLATAVPRIAEACTDASLMVVQGDTKSALAGARAAAFLGIRLAHVEAGVRSGDLNNPWPEEGYRREISQFAMWHYAPTATCRDHLLEESIAAEQIILSGNPVVSAIARYSDVRPVRIPDLTILFTMHRREWLHRGIRETLAGFAASAERYPEVRILWPVHPSIAPHLPDSWICSLPTNAHIRPPLPYAKTLALIARSLGVVTDSGGLVEECATLGTPCAVTRYVTDRPEAIDAHVARLFQPTAEGVIAAFEVLRKREILRHPSSIYGTPASARIIADHLSTTAKTSSCITTYTPGSSVSPKLRGATTAQAPTLTEQG